MSRISMACLFTCLMISTVNAQEAKKPLRGGKVTAKAAKAAVKGGITDAEGEAWATAFVDALKAGDYNAVDRMIDWQAFLAKTTEGTPSTEAARQTYQKSVPAELKKENGVWNALTKLLNQGGSLTLLHIRHEQGRTSDLFRLITSEDGGINYHDYVLKRGADGKVRMADLYIYAGGETLSQMFRREFREIAAYQQRGVLDRLTGKESEFIKHFEDFRAMNEAAEKGDHQKAVKIYDSLPPSLKKEHNIAINHLLTVQEVDETLYAKALDEFEANYPNDPALLLLSIDTLLTRKRYDDCIKAIDRLDKKVGGDPYLEWLRAGVDLTAENINAAKGDLDRCIEKDPTLRKAHFARLNLAVKEKDHAVTLKMLEALSGKLGVTIKDLTTVPTYADFVKSPEYEQWKTFLDTQDTDSTSSSPAEAKTGRKEAAEESRP